MGQLKTIQRLLQLPVRLTATNFTEQQRIKSPLNLAGFLLEERPAEL